MVFQAPFSTSKSVQEKCQFLAVSLLLKFTTIPVNTHKIYNKIETVKDGCGTVKCC